MSLRDKRSVSDLLHGRWSDKSPYVYLRLNGEGYEGDRQRIHQPVDIMERDASGLWLPKDPQSDDGPDEIRVYETGMGDLKDIILDHPGGCGSVIYRVGVKARTYLDKKTGKKKDAWCFKVTDKLDMAQKSLPPTSSEPQAAAPGGPSGGPQQSSNGMHSQQPAPTSPGPISQAPPAPVPSLQGQGANPLCASCGKPAAGLSFCPHCGVKQ